MKLTMGVALALLATAALAREPAADKDVKSPLSALPQAEQRECEAFGETYLRIAEMRDAGGDKLVAVDRGVQFLSGLGRTGSNHRGMNYKPAVTQFADFVYANPKLNRRTVYLYGLSSCAISKKAPDDPTFESAMVALEKSIGPCQSKYPQQEQVKPLAACVLEPVNVTLQKWAVTTK